MQIYITEMEVCKEFNYSVAYRLDKGEYVVKASNHVEIKIDQNG